MRSRGTAKWQKGVWLTSDKMINDHKDYCKEGQMITIIIGGIAMGMGGGGGGGLGVLKAPPPPPFFLEFNVHKIIFIGISAQFVGHITCS